MWSLREKTGSPGGSEGRASACNVGDPGSIPGLGRSPGEGNGSPLRYSCLENPMDGGQVSGLPQDSKNPIIPKSARAERLNPKTAPRIQKSGQARHVGSHTIPGPHCWQEGVRSYREKSFRRKTIPSPKKNSSCPLLGLI